MSLPQLTSPTYDVKLFSLPTPVTLRPYTVAEEKIFLMAKESGAPEDVERAVRQILTNCTFGKVDITKLPSFDVEFLFIQLRARSVSNMVTLIYECQNPVTVGAGTGIETSGRCKNRVQVNLDLDTITIQVPPEHSTLVHLSDAITLQMRYPTADMLEQVLASGVEGIAMASTVIAQCIELILESDGTVHETSQSTPAEMQAFVDAIPADKLPLLYQFFSSMPSLQCDATFTCSKCGYTEPLHFQGLQDFFG